MLRLRVLGPLRVEVDGNPLDPPRSRRARSLLAWLALHGGPHARSEVAGRFWPDVLDESARASLRGALTELRRSLGDAADAVIATRDRVELASDERVWLDLAEFERRAGAGELDEALELARGELLADLDDDWVHAAREEHRQRLSDVLERRAAAAEAAGDWPAAVEATRRQVALDALGEEQGRRLIERLWRSGEPASALTAYEALRERLARDLGMAPSAATRELVAAIRAGSARDSEVEDAAEARTERPPRADAPPASVAETMRSPAALAGRRAGEIVGRDAELAALRAAWERAHGERHQTVTLCGEPGIGKTRLATEFARERFDAGTAVLYGRCEEEALVPYQPWVEALEQHALGRGPDELRRDVGSDGPELARLVPAIGQKLAPLPDHVRDEPDTERYRLFAAVAATLRRIAEAQSLLVVLDDLHWADKGSLLLLRHVERSLSGSPAVVIAAFREGERGDDDPLTQTLAQLRRSADDLTAIRLRGLDDAGVAALVERRRGSADERFARTLREETAGNPFFVEEVLRSTPEGAPAGAGAVPDGVRQVIAQRLRSLSEAARTALSFAAVVGREFDLTLLERVSALPRETLSEALDEAERANVVSDVPGTVGRWTFFHALTRATLYDDLSRTRRAQIHLLIGEALEELHLSRRPVQLAEVAHHLREAAALGVAGRAVEYSEGAAAYAVEQLAFEEAALQYRRALDALDHVVAAEPAHRIELLLALGEAETNAGEARAAREAFYAAAMLARDETDGELLARAALGFAGPNWQTFGELDEEAVELLHEALERLPESDGQLRALVLAGLSSALYFGEARQLSVAVTREAVAMARRLGSRGALGAALEASLWADWTPDRVDARLATVRELRELGESAGAEETVASARRWGVVALLERADMDSAWREIDAHAEVAGRLGQAYELMYTSIFATMRALYEGRWDDAVEGSTRVAGIEQRRAGADARQFVGVHGLTLAFEQGGIEHLEAPIAEFARSYPRVPAWRAPLPLVLARGGRGEEARTALAELAPGRFAVLPRDANWIPGIAWLALAAAELGEAGHARTLYELLAPYERHAVVLGAGGAVWGLVAYYLGLLAPLAGREQAAAKHLERAVDFAAATGGRPWEARARAALEGQPAAATGRTG